MAADGQFGNLLVPNVPHQIEISVIVSEKTDIRRIICLKFL